MISKSKRLSGSHRILLASLSISIAFLLHASVAYGAEEPLAVSLKAGEAAPFAGSLVPPMRMANIAVKAGDCDEKITLELRFAKRASDNDLQLTKRLLRADLDSCTVKKALWQREYERARAWYTQPPIVAGAAAAITTAIIFGATYIVKKVQ